MYKVFRDNDEVLLGDEEYIKKASIKIKLLPLINDILPDERLPSLQASTIRVEKGMTMLALRKYIFRGLGGAVEKEEQVRLYFRADFIKNVESHNMMSLQLTDGSTIYYSKLLSK
jgi:hypothetical protein